jgi:hypothetical protein
MLQREVRSIRVANGVEAEVKAIEELPLELNNDFILHLHNCNTPGVTVAATVHLQ